MAELGPQPTQAPLVHWSVDELHERRAQPWPGSPIAGPPAGHSGQLSGRCLQASSVSGSGLGPELHQAGSLNEMAPKFLKWFNKTYTDCNVQFIVANYCPSVGKNDLQSVILLSAS